MYCDPLPYPCRAKRTFRVFANNFESKKALPSDVLVQRADNPKVTLTLTLTLTLILTLTLTLTLILTLPLTLMLILTPTTRTTRW